MSWILDFLSELRYQIGRHTGGTWYTSRRARRARAERIRKAKGWVALLGRRY